MMSVPIVALIVAGSMSAGGFDAMAMSIEAVVRHTLTALADFIRGLF